LRVRNPLTLLVSAAPWASAWYLATYLVLGAVWFSISLAVLLTSSVLAVTWIGLPLLLAAFGIVRALAAAERGRAGIVGVHVRGRPRRRPGPGTSSRLLTCLRDAASWRDVLLLVVLWPWLLALDLAALMVWLLLLAVISLPAWYRYPPQSFNNGEKAHGVQLGYYPDGPRGTQRYGWFIDSAASAWIAAGVGVVLLALVGNYVVLGAARVHARTVARIVGA
jgi:hypothetical protein